MNISETNRSIGTVFCIDDTKGMTSFIKNIKS